MTPLETVEAGAVSSWIGCSHSEPGSSRNGARAIGSIGVDHLETLARLRYLLVVGARNHGIDTPCLQGDRRLNRPRAGKASALAQQRNAIRAALSSWTGAAPLGPW